MKNFHAPLVYFAAIFFLGMNSEANAADWPQFRGPGGLGVSEETDLPVRWSETENLAWRRELPGYGDQDIPARRRGCRTRS